MKIKESKNAILSRLKANWTGSAALPLAYPNARFKQPEGAWARASLQTGANNSVAIGGLRDRTVGVLTIQVFLPEKSGTDAAYDAAALVSSIFRNWRSSPEAGLAITFEQTSVIGPITRENHIQFNLQTPFRIDETF